MTTTEVAHMNPDTQASKKKAKKLAKKDSSTASMDAPVEATGDTSLNVEGEDAPRKNQYAELIAKKMRTLRKKLVSMTYNVD